MCMSVGGGRDEGKRRRGKLLSTDSSCMIRAS